MRAAVLFIGTILAIQGIGGAIDHLVPIPSLLGVFIAVFNRVVISRVDFLAGYELFAHLGLAVLGLIITGVALPYSADRRG